MQLLVRASFSLPSAPPGRPHEIAKRMAPIEPSAQRQGPQTWEQTSRTQDGGPSSGLTSLMQTTSTFACPPDLRQRLYRQGQATSPLVRGKAGHKPRKLSPHPHSTSPPRKILAFSPQTGPTGAPTTLALPPMASLPPSSMVVPHTNVKPLPIREPTGVRAMRSVSPGRREGEAPMELEGKEEGAGERKEPNLKEDPNWIDPADFVEFILNHESLTEEFCYMNRSGPYEFQIVPFSKINPHDYMTISLRGVTHYHHGEVEFTTLQEWQRDQELYRRIIAISFFAKYRKWKMFSVWKRIMRDHSFRKCAKTLTSNLFVLDSSLRGSLLKVRALCFRLTSWPLIHYDLDRTYTLQEFLDVQQRRRGEILAELNTIWTAIRDEVLQSCTYSLQAFLEANGFGPGARALDAESRPDDTHEASRAVTANKSRRGDTSAIVPAAGRGAGMIVPRPPPTQGKMGMGGDSNMSYTERATTRTQCRKLTKFIRTAQYLFSDAIASLARNSTTMFLDSLIMFIEKQQRRELENQGPQEAGGSEDFTKKRRPSLRGGKGPMKGPSADRPIFVVSVVFDPTGIDFNPSGHNFRASIEAVLLDAVRTVCSCPTFLQLDDFQPFTAPLAELGDDRGEEATVDLFSQITADASFKKLMRDIGRRFDELFHLLVAHARQYQDFVTMYVENEGTTLSDFQDVELLEFAKALDKYKSQQDSVKALQTQVDLGLFQLDGTEMQKTLVPSPTRCWQLLTKYIPELAMDKTAELTQQLKEANEKLAQLPGNVDEYVEFMSLLNEVLDGVPDTDRKYQYIADLFELLNQHEVRITSTQRNAFFELATTVNALRTQLQFSQESSESNVSRFSKELQHDIPQLYKDVERVAERLEDKIFENPKAKRAEVLERIEEIEEMVKAASSDAVRYNRYQEVLKMDVTPFEEVEDMKGSFQVKAKLWRSIDAWDKLSKVWNDTQFSEIDVETIQKEIQVYNKVALQSEKAMPENPVVFQLKDVVINFKNTMPVVLALRNKALKERHWTKINELIGQTLELDNEDFTLGRLLEMGVGQYTEDIQDISGKATAELALEEMLDKAKGVWQDTQLTVLSYKDSKDVFILGGVDEVIATLEDSLVTISTIAGSRYVGPIRDEVEGWQKNLILFQETLDEWLQVQRNWMYLESIFSAGDIRKQLPSESQKFSAVDSQWKAIMKETNEYGVAFKACTKTGRLELFRQFNETLDEIQKSLEDYLQSKREAFPRFFFLSNDELLEILAQARRPQAVQPHLRKCFDNLVKLRLGDDARSADIHAMISGEGEEVEFYKVMKARGPVEKWLLEVEDHMVKSLQVVVKNGWKEYAMPSRKDWVANSKAQVVSCVSQIMWCSETEEVLHSDDPLNKMNDWFDKNVEQLSDLTALVRGKLSSIQRKSVVALAIQDVHNRDIVDELRKAQVTDVNNFKWQQQLKYYWDTDEDDCIIRQVDARIRFGYEYQGATSRLVITPLTDRCWLTITGALHIKLGAAPAGPAGTGKTESTKDLAKAIARQCVVFNCSDQIDYKMMAKLYSGVVTAGAWTCLDEFNRIDIEVLSVIAQQLLTIRVALLDGKSEFLFEGRVLKLKPTLGVFITMNPGYAGRTELPDNLKVLFRPVSMMVPDYTLIAEIMLFAEGFGEAKKLSGKFTKLYKLSSEQLSQQDHYDFGMRAVKSVLVMAGALKRAEPDLSEDIVLIRAMRDSNVPKFLAHDLPLFYAIVSDLFPGVEVPFIDYGELQSSIEACMAEGGYQVHEPLIKKVIQLYETFNVRFGVMLVGPTTGGKTVCYKMLAGAMTKLRKEGHPKEDYQVVHYSVLNPKCITMGELYGEFNELTQEWTDGLGSTIMRGYVSEETPDKKWTIFDGPVDAIWIENMNTVLDDNMTLCLANGERIKLKQEMRMLFEVQDLAVASPATVSRCGMVYLTPSDLGWRPYAKTWLHNLPTGLFSENLKTKIWDLFEAHVDKGLAFVRKNCVEPVVSVDNNLVYSLCNLFHAVLNPNAGTPNGIASVDAEDGKPAVDVTKSGEKFVESLIPMVFAFAYTWALGGSLDTLTREKFAKFAEDQMGEGVQWPRGGGVYDGFVDLKFGKIRAWDEILPTFHYTPDASYFSLLVPNKDTVRFAYVLDRMIHQRASVFFTGVSGIGKSVIAANLLDKLKAAGRVSPIFMTFSAQTKAIESQLTIEGKLEKKRKTLLGAPPGVDQVVVFVDDVNMPAVETYGAQPPIELLRQFQDFKGFYDRKKLFWKEIENTMLLLCAAPPGGGRNELTPRFVRHSHILCMPATSEEAMTVIFMHIIQGFLAQGFKSEVALLSRPVVESTIEIYTRISAELLPTPARSHYTFNLRDVSKVFQGVLMVKPMHATSADAFTRLWIHETMRVFHDRLIDENDKGWFRDAMIKLLQGKFRLQWTADDTFINNTIMWGDYLRPGADQRVYEEVKDMGKVAKLLEDYCDEYNLTHSTPMNLVFFKDAIEHVSRIARILRQPRGNAMLVGVGGSGKQSLTRLAASLSEMESCEVAVVKGYGVDLFREDERKFMLKAGGGEGKPTTFLFTDSQIIDETFLEDINNILNAGEVPNLFPSDEVDRIVNDLRPIAKEKGRSEGRDPVYQFFVERVRENLHIVLCMSPVGDALRIRMRMFPSLVNCCTIDWFHPWPEDALKSVATRFLANLQVDEPIKHGLIDMCKTVHMSVIETSHVFLERLRRHVYVTPKSYLDLISLYLKMLEEKTEQLSTQRNRLAVGVTKLEETNKEVANLKTELTALEPVLKQKKQEAEELLVVVTEDQKNADIEKAKVDEEAKIVGAQAEEVAALQADAQKDLDVAMPALNAALAALDSLDKKDITEIKSFAKPPPLVMMTMEAVNILLSEKPDWDSAKKVLSDTGFLARLKNFDKDNIPQPILKKLEKYVQKPEYSPDSVGAQSKAAKSLCMWTHAMDTYSKVAKEVEPKKRKLEEMNAQLDAANAKLKEAKEKLQSVLDKVAALEKQLEDTNNEKNRLIHEAQLTEARLVRAGQLTGGLADEQVRWKESVDMMAGQIRNLIGDVFLSAACISYYGPFTGQYRDEIVAKWLEKTHEQSVPASDSFDLKGIMGNPVELRDWNIKGLPSDDVSLNNGILVSRGTRWPLMIDPQAQANKWIKNMESPNGIKITKLADPRLLNILEACIRLGQPMLIEDIGEQLDPALEPVLAKAVFDNNGRLQIHLGDSDVDYDMHFKFYMTTKMPNPHYLPEVCIKVTVINFTVTYDGLTQQLLGDVVKKEIPETEERNTKLILQMAEDKATLKGLEDTILRLLSESSGEILDDIELINTLSQSKVTANDINKRVEESEIMAVEIKRAREQYTPVAIRGSILYFVIADLANIDPMYQFSLTYFTRLFNKVIDSSAKRDVLEERLAILVENITSVIYSNICRGLFERHKLIFSFIIAMQILRQEEEKINAAEWSLLLRGPGLLSTKDMPKKPDQALISDKSWLFLYGAQCMATCCSDICQHIKDNLEAWREWIAAAEPQEVPLPARYEEVNELLPFHKLLVIKALREEKVSFAVAQVVEKRLGRSFVEVALPRMEEIYADTTSATPVIFVLSTGADPTGMLLRFASEKGIPDDRLGKISLGQGQGPRAKKLIEQASRDGSWVLLQNCHLAKSWMPQLEKIVEGFPEDPTLHPDFRLWLTSMPAPYFPVPVLQNGVKLTNEPPKGIRANVKRSLMDTTEAELEGCSRIHEWKKIRFGLQFFHAIVQERRKFGPLGWNVRYEFNNSDLETSVTVLKNILEGPFEKVPFDTLLFVIGQINYGGRVTDDLDRRLLMSILNRYVTNSILEDDYVFSESGTYKAPVDGDLAAYVSYVEQLPLSDSPEIFGMHDNANINFQKQESDAVLTTVLSIQPREGGGGGGKSPDQIVLEVAESISGRVPALLSEEGAHPSAFAKNAETGIMESLGTCLTQEMQRFNKLLRKMSSSLSLLKKAVKGLIVMSEDLDLMYGAFLNNQVPSVWSKVAYPSLKPLTSWFEDLIERVKFFAAWIETGKPRAFWISSFFFPQGFLTAVLQAYSRKYQVPIDILSFEFIAQQFQDAQEIEEPPEEGCYIYGMFFDGARWDFDKMVIEDQLPGVMYEPAPIVHFQPCEHYKPNPSDYTCPLYKTSVRAGTLSTTGHSTNFVIAIEIPTEKPPDYWVLKGAAFLCMLND
ncbi:unnamed protein product [Vitrella brassicaformis CCMP3155]|uniref:Uncharacterized protein n=5 Tax=Vitrella brassicaformis TaxID=1169539 RepID=A0A0G4EPL6_VITBC|nr:unnamed protein product [Vitrella brassicaformis CCMP3155]|eukprot:CEL99773.1 unnamed protein product [Vitrella brassicaformis CCMP3155]